jgi:hypothetical protein
MSDPYNVSAYLAGTAKNRLGKGLNKAKATQAAMESKFWNTLKSMPASEAPVYQNTGYSSNTSTKSSNKPIKHWAPVKTATLVRTRKNRRSNRKSTRKSNRKSNRKN